MGRAACCLKMYYSGEKNKAIRAGRRSSVVGDASLP